MSSPNVIIGNWIPDETGQLVGDASEKLIQEAVEHRFKRLAIREGGWTSLYLDPSDSSFWELTYPHSEMHGGGPRTLTRLSTDDAKRLYPDLEGGH